MPKLSKHLIVTSHPILQFGTSRFLQAHVDLFVSQALPMNQALGKITVIQTTDSPESSRRAEALATGAGYPVRVRGLRHGAIVDETIACTAIGAAMHAASHWQRILELASEGEVRVIVSNTGDSGWRLADGDSPALLVAGAGAPLSYPAKLLALLHRRWQLQPEAPLSILPCELVSRNGTTLAAIVIELARQWQLSGDFIAWLARQVVWANSLVDRIVSEPLHPVGAVAEPYALWAIERQPGLVVPCEHPAVVHVDDLQLHERLKLHLLNLGHTVLADLWLAKSAGAHQTVFEAMNDAPMRTRLEAIWRDEVLPVFEALGQQAQAEAYLVDLRERLLNPFLVHRLADIAQHHAQKKARRLAPVLALAASVSPQLSLPRLEAVLARGS